MRLGCCGGAFVATWRAASRVGMTQRVFGDAQCDALERDATRHVATKTVGSTVDWRNARLAWYAHGDGGGMGGGIFALRRPRPYSRRLRGFRSDALPPTIICDHVGINGTGEREGNDAARCVATSSENRENRV